MYTGKDHWIPLLRARAIENFCYVIAPNQYGKHSSSMRSFGRSAIIDPWGNPIAIASDGKGFALASIDLSLVARVREQMPCLDHRHRLFRAIPVASTFSQKK
jgi:predicted amidohydrolase